VRAVPIVEDGRLVEWIGTNTDITPRKNQEEFREQVIGIVGHDLRNPLSTISMMAALLERRPDAGEATHRAAERIAVSADRMRRMIADLLDFTRARLGTGIPLQHEVVDLHELCINVVDELKLLHPDRELRCAGGEEREGVAMCECDADRMSQVLHNLLGNALAYGAADRPILLRLDCRSADQIRVDVVSHGKPIPREALPLLFEPFKRATQEPNRRAAGLGLGLYIVRKIVEAHGGRVEVESTAEQTRFGVTLPRRRPPMKTSA
jgi:signal transduction histidine kinase